MADNATAFASLDSMIDSVRAVPNLAREAAPDCARAVELDIERTIKAATTSDGKAWAPKKEGSGKPLEGAEKHLRVVAIGTQIFATLRGHIARHHLGRAKGGAAREILPTTSTIPDRMSRAIQDVLARRFRQVVGP